MIINQDAINEYSESIRRFRKQCLDAGVNEEDFRKMYFETLESLDTINANPSRMRVSGFINKITRKYRYVFVGVVIMLFALYNTKNIYSHLVCNLQDYVYPGLRLLRRISIPFLVLFPSLTDLYHESCLIQNPVFSVMDMDCWPCGTVNNIREVNDPRPIHLQHTAPFVYKTDQEIIHLNQLKDLYINHKDTFDKQSSTITLNNKISITPANLFQRTENGDDKNVYLWRFNNMNLVRVLRQIIPRPKVVPKFGQSTERFLIIDSSQEPFPVPDTECNFSFLLSLSGKHVVKLIPAEECIIQCKSSKIELKESYLLWYNWWYWRPVIEPSTVNVTLIAHVGSYC